MTLFISKVCTLRLFLKTLDVLKPWNIQCRHQGRNVASRKKLTPRRAPVEVVNPSSLASNTRSKKQLQLE